MENTGVIIYLLWLGVCLAAFIYLVTLAAQFAKAMERITDKSRNLLACLTIR